MPQDTLTTAGLSRPAATLWPLARRGFAWWTAELSSMLPPGLLARLSPSEQSGPFLEIGRDDATLLLPVRGGSAPARLPLGEDDPAALRGRVRAALRHHRSSPSATIRLDPSLVLETSLTLPVQANPSCDRSCRTRSSSWYRCRRMRSSSPGAPARARPARGR